jgi:glycine oxidase
LSARSEHHDVAVVGGGVIGLAVAWRAAQRGLRTVVLDAAEDGAWRYAAGMLAPVTEAEFGEDALLALGLRAADGFPAFCAQLAEASGRDPGLRRTGTLVVARDRDEAEELERLLEHRRSLGLEVERLRPSQARRAEPALAPTVRLALDVPGDAAVDPRRLVAALAEAFERAGGEIRRGRVTAVEPGVVTVGATPAAAAAGTLRATPDAAAAGSLGAHHVGAAPDAAAAGTLRAEHVVVAAGAWSGQLGAMPVRPVKGQIMRLRDPAGQDLVTRTIRTRDGYLVPRGEGRYVLGATVEERGWDTAATSGATLELIRDLAEVVPGVLELEIEELGAGLRPGTPDNLPVIGPAAGLVWATGHYRSGILLADVTAEAVVSVLAGDGLPDWAAPCDPARFAEVHA